MKIIKTSMYDENLEPLQIALDSPPQKFGGYGSEFLGHLDNDKFNYTFASLLRHSLTDLKQAAWKNTAENFGYGTHFYSPMPPEGFKELNDQGKEAIIQRRAMSLVHSFITSLSWLLDPNYTHYVNVFKRQKIILDPQIAKWIKFMETEVEKDPDILSSTDADKRDEEQSQQKRKAEGEKMEQLTAQLGEQLWRNRRKIEQTNSAWKGMTQKDCFDMALSYVEKSPYDRGQFMPIIREIAKSVMGRAAGFKSFYMDDKDTRSFLQTIGNAEPKTMTDSQLVELVNKTVGILNTDDIHHMGWGEVHPALSAGELGQIAGLRMQSVTELQQRLSAAKDNRAKISDIYGRLDPETRKFFFTV